MSKRRDTNIYQKKKKEEIQRTKVNRTKTTTITTSDNLFYVQKGHANPYLLISLSISCLYVEFS
uniref:Uncharacterized protein n=1 Tax=Nelumbo nucifera TaxID=4432 RepID=A0A822YW67_NELNU|nr:TPA_asm: hypothetical protein HUJ06_007401 [Nelumbo nucifera]